MLYTGTWQSKKHSVVARSSAIADFQAMATDLCEMIWLQESARRFENKTREINEALL